MDRVQAHRRCVRRFSRFLRLCRHLIRIRKLLSFVGEQEKSIFDVIILTFLTFIPHHTLLMSNQRQMVHELAEEQTSQCLNELINFARRSHINILMPQRCISCWVLTFMSYSFPPPAEHSATCKKSLILIRVRLIGNETVSYFCKWIFCFASGKFSSLFQFLFGVWILYLCLWFVFSLQFCMRL